MLSLNHRRTYVIATLVALNALGIYSLASHARKAAQSYTPAFADQKNARQLPSTAVEVETVRADLEQPWGMDFLPDGRLLITQKEGSLLLLSADFRQKEILARVSQVQNNGQGGLLDVAYVAGATPHICMSFAEARDGEKSGTSVACGRWVDGATPQLVDLKVIWRQQPAWDSAGHYGSRIVPLPNGDLFVTTGDRQDKAARPLTQRLDTLLGKVIRIRLDGSSPSDNPFVGRVDARGEIWSYGHRNLQGAALDTQGRLWTVEHGPRGGDELNRPQAGKNYGWPIISYGKEYSGAPVGAGITQHKGMEQPIYYWDPVIGAAGMIFYQGKAFSDWHGDIVMGGLVSQGLVRLKLQQDRVIGEERIALDARVRDVAQGPDDFIYAITDAAPGALLRVRPKK